MSGLYWEDAAASQAVLSSVLSVWQQHGSGGDSGQCACKRMQCPGRFGRGVLARAVGVDTGVGRGCRVWVWVLAARYRRCLTPE